ncbi:MAG: flagellin [Desulfobacter sp.]
MTLKINTNISALNAHRSMLSNDSQLTDSLERLATGLRINKAADDSSGMAIADSLKAQSLGIGQAIRNANDGISMVQTADGALQESINIINTIKTKAIQAASDAQTTSTRRAIQNDIDKLMEELDAIALTTSFNGQKLLSGSFTNRSIQVGAFANETASISIDSTESGKVGHISQAQLSMASSAGGEVQLTITSAITGEELTLNTIDLQYNNDPENGMGALANEVNRYTSVTGISANAVVQSTTSTAIQEGTTGSSFAINGVIIGAIPVEANDNSGSLVNAINSQTSETGVEAFMTSDGKLTLSSTDGRAIEVEGSVSDIFGSTAGQMSTIGYLELTQTGVSEFQIEGIGAGATGGDITITGDVETVEDSTIAAGSTIIAGSKLASGSEVGGDALVESSVASTQLDYELMAGTTLYPTTQIAKGTVLGGSITIAGDTQDSSGAGLTALDQDMLVTAGTTLDKHTILGKGTVVTTRFTSTASGAVVVYDVGDTLASAVELTQDITLSSDMTLVYNSTTSDNTQIKAGSVLTSGSTMGAEFEIGVTYDTGSANQAITADTATVNNIYLNSPSAGTVTWGTTGTGAVAVIKAGSLLTSGTVLTLPASAGLADTLWDGPTLITTAGVLEVGDSFAGGTVITLSGDQVLSADLTRGSALSSTANQTLAAGSILTVGSISSAGINTGSAYTATLSSATLANDMVLESGSELAAGSELIAGSILGNNTYVMGGTLSATLSDLETYKSTDLASGSNIENGSVLAEGSTIGGTVTVASATTLDSDMSVTAGTKLAQDTILAAGTTLNQDMTLNTGTGGSGSSVELKAGDVLTTDLYVQSASGITLSEDMVLVEKSVIEANSELAVNTSNSGSVGLSDTETYKLADLSVLDAESAQRAISIADAALADIDEIRAALGSVQNQLSSTISNLSVTQTNIQASESTIRDVDFAEESMMFSKMQLLSQTSSYALAQANASAENIMSLLQ